MSAKPFSCAACRSISLICCPLSWGTCSIRTLEGTVDRLRLSKALPKSWRSDGQLSGVRWRLRVLAGGRIFTCRHRTE